MPLPVRHICCWLNIVENILFEFEWMYVLENGWMVCIKYMLKPMMDSDQDPQDHIFNHMFYMVNQIFVFGVCLSPKTELTGFEPGIPAQIVHFFTN